LGDVALDVRLDDGSVGFVEVWFDEWVDMGVVEIGD
jgi:hypothetical protein